MEDPTRSANVGAFIRDSSASTVAGLKRLPGYEKLHAAVDEASQTDVRFGDARFASGKLFYRRIDKGAQLAKLAVRAANGSERVLYDPAKPLEGISGAINTYSVSPSGVIVALHTAGGGSEVGAVRFIDAATGNLLPEKLEPVWGEAEVNWLDDTTFSYLKMVDASGGGDAMQNMKAHVGRLGGPESGPLLGGGSPASPDFPAQDFPFILFETDSDWALGIGGGARADARILIAEKAAVLSGKPKWREVAGLSERVSGIGLSGDRLYALTTKRSPNGEVVAINLRAGEALADAQVVVPAGQSVLSEIVAAEDGLYILGQSEGLSQLYLLPRGAEKLIEVALPMRGVVNSLRRRRGAPGVTFAMQDWFTANRFFVATNGQVTSLGLKSASHAVPGARHLREAARSADGTEVPLDIILPPGAQEREPLPMLLEGYGSYGVNTAQPFYLSYRLGLLTAGGALAYCGTRGGGERGRSWHEAGRGTNKPNAHADLIACAERLVELGWTVPQKMTVTGTSAGGLLAPPVAMMRPDLFNGLVANVAVLNPTRLAAATNGANQFAEMGDPNTPEGYRALLAQDSYEKLLNAQSLPDTLLMVGLNDRRVEPWMSAKFAARALQRFGKERLILIRTDAEAGHGVGSTRNQLVDQFSDMFAFMLHQADSIGFTDDDRTSP